MKYQDIQLADVALRNQFIDYWMNGQYTQAFAIIANNPQLDTKAFTSTCFTLIAQAITVLEGYFFTNVTNYLTAQLTNYNAAISQFRTKNAYSSTTAYTPGNFVIYNSNVYLCIQDSTGNLPTNTTYWALVGLQGATGADGLDVTIKYEWNSTVTYAVNDVVNYQGQLYFAKQANSGQTPSSTSAYWDLFLAVPRAQIIVSQDAIPASELYDGLIWWRVLLAYAFAQVDAKAYTFNDVDNLGLTWGYISEGGW